MLAAYYNGRADRPRQGRRELEQLLWKIRADPRYAALLRTMMLPVD